MAYRVFEHMYTVYWSTCIQGIGAHVYRVLEHMYTVYRVLELVINTNLMGT